MTIDKALVERLAREAGLPMRSATGRPGAWPLWEDELRRFAALVAEECAKVVDQMAAEAEAEHEPAEAAAYYRARAAAIRAKFGSTT